MKKQYFFWVTVAVIMFSFGFGTVMVCASTDTQSVNISYHVRGNGNGQVSGKTNKVWHYFQKNRTITLKITSRSGKGVGKATLYRNRAVILDRNMGNVSASVGSHRFPSKTDLTSGQYYLRFWGGNSLTTQKVKGSIHD